MSLPPFYNPNTPVWGALNNFNNFGSPEQKQIPQELVEPILDSILEDDVEKFGELASSLEDDINAPFKMNRFQLPPILSSNPTLISLCCFFNSINCFNFLRDIDADLDSTDQSGRVAAHFAAAGGSLDIIRVIETSELTKKDNNRMSVLHYAAMFGRLEVVKYLWSKGINIINDKDRSNSYPIHIASLYGHTEVIKFLVENGARCEYRNKRNSMQPLHYACIGGHVETIKFLLGKKVDINMMYDSQTPISYAARYGSLAAVKLLVENGAQFKFKRRKYSPIVEAATGGHIDVVNYFLEQKCDVNIYTSLGATPLIEAVSQNHTELVKFLLQHGARIPTQVSEKSRFFFDYEYDVFDPLTIACNRENVEIAEMILQNSIIEVNKDDNRENIEPMNNSTSGEVEQVITYESRNQNKQYVKKIDALPSIGDNKVEDKNSQLFTTISNGKHLSSDNPTVLRISDPEKYIKNVIYKGSVTMLRVLMKYISIEYISTLNAFFFALKLYDIEIVNFLFECGFNFHNLEQKEKALLVRIKHVDGNDDFSNLDYDHKLSKLQNTLFQRADINLIKLFQDKGLVFDCDKYSLIDSAIFEKNPEFLKYVLDNFKYDPSKHKTLGILLKMTIEPSIFRNYYWNGMPFVPLFSKDDYASGKRNKNALVTIPVILDMLLEAGFPAPDFSEQNLSINTVITDNLNLLYDCLKKIDQLHKLNFTGMDPVDTLKRLVNNFSENKELIDFFFSRGLVFDEKLIRTKSTFDNSWNNRSDCLFNTNDLQAIEYLLDHGAPVNSQPLRKIAKTGNQELIKKAFKNIRYNKELKGHKTPLELACKLGLLSEAKNLIISDPKMINESGFGDFASPLMFAKKSKNQDLIDYIIKHNGKMPSRNPKGCINHHNGFNQYFKNFRK
ncbi:hypothetical protein TRFO_37992 [Tritrichomonas foetus]|uniref:Uncharacterized protein n=1 Tax=Tritrichomonas foetus TaxID=1144522 RepID=A0A1J4J9K6_9EUKA|nr:hypothetical protein TRFO_37992 [Tritrichomonas foetus]|eukprot:OHS95840.1 hypothetical protein TRFO_37992 [Tritrichomonas foetus]